MSTTTAAKAPARNASVRTALGRRRRLHELGLGVHAIVVVISAYVVLALADNSRLPSNLPLLLGGVIGVYAVAHLAVRRLAPNADGTLLPIVAMLNGIGFVMITRLDRRLAGTQATWTLVGVAAFVVTLWVIRDIRVVARYRYSCALAGIVLLLLPLAPSPIGRTINGARIWARVGVISFQPGELAKILLAAFFAGYLVDTRALLAVGTTRLGRFRLPDPRHLAPLVVIWAISILVLVFEKDLGSSLLLFFVFASMLYVATDRAAYALGGLGLFALSGWAANRMFAHVHLRVTTWLNPWPNNVRNAGGFQVIQSWYAFANGGLSGRGLGLGAPDKVPVAVSDFILAAIGEELGFLGTAAVVMLVLLLVGTGLRIAVDHDDAFTKLFITGLTVILAVQTFVIVGGVTRLIPLTGVTLPFVSYGGSSLIGNFIVIALLARASDASVRDAAQRRRREARRA